MRIHHEGYLRFLVERDGAADRQRRTLARREAFFATLVAEPVRSTTPIDRAAYRRNVDRRRPEPGLDPRVRWLLATANANRAERFGVGLAELYGRVGPPDEPVRLHVQLQEVYHTRILADVVAMFDLAIPQGPPGLATRALVHLLVRMPERWTLPLTGAAEMAGCVIFRTLRDRGLDLFAHEAAVAGRIRRLFDEILGDELGHVGLIASVLGERGRASMRRLYRLLAVPLSRQIPAMTALLGSRELRGRFRATFRPELMAAELPGLAYVAASV